MPASMRMLRSAAELRLSVPFKNVSSVLMTQLGDIWQTWVHNVSDPKMGVPHVILARLQGRSQGLSMK